VPGAGLDVVVVIALERAADHAQPRTSAQECFVHAVRHEGHEGLGILRALQNLVQRQSLRTRIGNDLAVFGQKFDDFGVHAVGKDDFWFHFELLRFYLNRFLSMPLNASTSVTMARITSSNADTSWYCMMRSEPISSKPMPPAPTMPITVEARKLYSQR